MSGPFQGTPGRFTPGELDGVSGVAPAEIAADQRTARELEDLAGRTTAQPSAGFADRVMGAIAAEPAPAPARVARLALRRGALGAFLLSLGDAWRVTIGRGFPVAVRAQAFALVLVVVALGAGASVATAGALGLLDPDQGRTPVVNGPSPSPEQPAVLPAPSPSLEMPSATPKASERPEASDDAAGSHPPETDSPTGTREPEATDDRGGESGTGSGSGLGNHGGTPTATPAAGHGSRTPEPSDDDGDDPGESHHGGSSGTPGPSETPDD